MYLSAKFGDHRSHSKGYISSSIKSYMNNMNNRHIARLLISGIPIYSSAVPDTTGRKTTRRRTQEIAKCVAFNAKAIKQRKIGADILTKIKKCLQKEV